MSYGEFPYADYSSIDMSEFIRMYKELRDAYQGTLDRINTVNKRLDEYEASMDSKAAQAVANAMVAYQAELTHIKTDILNLNTSITNLRNYTDAQDEKLKLNIDRNYDIIIELIDNEKNLMIERLNASLQVVNTRIDRLSDTVDANKLELLDMIELQNLRIETINDKTYSEMIVRDTATLAKAEDYTNLLVGRLQEEIDEIERVTDGESLKWLWDNGCNFGGYDAYNWYMDTSITAEEWSKRKFTAVDWYVRGREVFHYFDRRNFMFSPVSGKRVPVQYCILELANLFKNGLTAEEYDRLQVTAQEYESKKIPAFNYDWDGKELLDA